MCLSAGEWHIRGFRMILYIMDDNYNFIGAVDEYPSLIWTTRYYDKGDAELQIKADLETIAMLRENYYLVREDKMTEEGYGEVAIITGKEITTSQESGAILKITAEMADAILSRRIVWNQTTMTGNAEECIRKLIEENIISPKEEQRKIENFVLDEKGGYAEELKDFDIQSAGDTVLDVVKSICETTKLGFRVILTTKNQFIFQLYKGVDRSVGQSENIPVVFSNEYDNLNSSDYTYNQEEYKNAGLVFGEGEGTSQRIVAVGTESGIRRREVKIDGSGVTSNGEIITKEKYLQMLKEYGETQMQEYKIKEGMSGDVKNDATYRLNEDYAMGDKVSVENEFKIGANTRVIEVIESWDETGEKVTPTFETWEVEQNGTKRIF